MFQIQSKLWFLHLIKLSSFLQLLLSHAIFGLRLSEEDEILGADFAEHGIESKDIGNQYSSRLSFREEKMKNVGKETSTYCSKGILNFRYLSISERVTSNNNDNNQESTESIEDIDKEN